MGKYRKSIVGDIEEKRQFEREQEALKQKYQLDTEKIVVEKSNMVKFAVRTFTGLIRITATILLFILAALGLMTLIYPVPREELLKVLHTIYLQIVTYLQV